MEWEKYYYFFEMAYNVSAVAAVAGSLRPLWLRRVIRRFKKIIQKKI